MPTDTTFTLGLYYIIINNKYKYIYYQRVSSYVHHPSTSYFLSFRLMIPQAH